MGRASVKINQACHADVANVLHCAGISRLERWERADELNLAPPPAVRALLLDHQDEIEYTEWQALLVHFRMLFYSLSIIILVSGKTSMDWFLDDSSDTSQFLQFLYRFHNCNHDSTCWYFCRQHTCETHFGVFCQLLQNLRYNTSTNSLASFSQSKPLTDLNGNAVH